jgi:hypothetical protein
MGRQDRGLHRLSEVFREGEEQQVTRGLEKAAWTVGIALAALSMAGCASAVPKNAPDWYRNAVHNEEHGFPDLRNVPTTHTANTDVHHWAEVEADLETAKQQLQSNPRSQPAPPDDPNAFVNDARAAIEATRAHHPGE